MTEAAIAASHEVMAVYADPSPSFSLKSDATPVTEADTRAEAAILSMLRKWFPDIPVVAEEEVASGKSPAAVDRFFLVDPLDGTKEFISRNGEFTVNIALIDNGVPVAGVVCAPALGEIFVGQGSQAWRGELVEGEIRNLRPIRTRPAPPRLVAVGSRSHGTEGTTDWLKRFDVDRFVSKGSSLKFCLVATGEADIYPRLGRTMEWDTAAGDAVLRAAGGIVTDMEGKPFRYNKRGQASDLDFANGHFVAYGDPRLCGIAAAGME
ncbi:3'(2'),5'-bisphosphate nucleotidase CysQ [Pseudaminobacter sp. 19-2017]|uniref:3'(2'),5'-bisphosphate nucleotidase CysQ n=1 Tax=Pseudaminobacter soli (ex Zhang et al. 2022) TaxID=2831468 RepID=A0A942DX31_9HYPH|nr:3'(2'),5'-bisphosphate nucleotidase CysQ [Pseudaminobacter soli]